MQIAALLMLAVTPAIAQQFVWDGDVDEVVILRLKDRRLAVTDGQGKVLKRPRYQLEAPLPGSRQTVRLQVREGRGSVRIVEQPNLDNDYTLTVQIEDRQPGASHYAIALDWDAGDSFDTRAMVDRLIWTGRVEGQAVISCREKTCNGKSAGGQPVVLQRVKSTRPLPKRRLRVMLEGATGRGEVRLLEQPSEDNGYTARVEIRDRESGSSEYSFTLSWQRPLRP